MSDVSEVQVSRGGCLCGAIRYEVNGNLPPVGMCHCSLCRRVSGSGSNAVLNVRAERFTLLSGTISEFRTPSGWGSFFCGSCGCPAPHRLSDDARVLVPAGTLDNDPGPRVAGHIFVGSKASWNVIGDDAPQFEEFPAPLS